jgi:hypothetical protein
MCCYKVDSATHEDTRLSSVSCNLDGECASMVRNALRGARMLGCKTQGVVHRTQQMTSLVYTRLPGREAKVAGLGRILSATRPSRRPALVVRIHKKDKAVENYIRI